MQDRNLDSDVLNPTKYIVMFFLVVVVFILAFMSYFRVDAGEKGVHLQNGAIKRVVDAGFYFKIPIIDSVEYISTRVHNKTFKQLSTYSKDQQAAEMDISVTFRIAESEVSKVYSDFKNIESLVRQTIDRHVPNQVENIFGQYSAIEAVQQRGKLTHDIDVAVKESLEGYPVIIESVQVEDIQYSVAYEQTVENRMKAEVEVQTQKQLLEKEKINAEIEVTKAQGVANSTLTKAKADAQAIILSGEAEAKAIMAKTEALRANSSLIELTKAEKWDGKLPVTMLPNSTLPFVDAKQ